MSSRIQTVRTIAPPEGLKLYAYNDLNYERQISSDIMLMHIASTADRLVREGHIVQRSFAVFTDLSTLYTGPELSTELSCHLMLYADFYRLPQDIREKLLPHDFKRVLIDLIKSENNEPKSQLNDSNEDNFTQEMKLSTSKAKLLSDIQTAKLVLTFINNLVELYNKISQNVSMYSVPRPADLEMMKEFMTKVQELEENIKTLRPHFEENDLYLHPARFMAGWQKEVFDKCIANYFEVGAERDLKINQTLVDLLTLFKDRLRATLLFFTDLPSAAVSSMHDFNPNFTKLSSVVSGTDFAGNFVHSAELLSVSGSTLPRYAECATPSEAREYYQSVINTIFPIKLVIVRSLADFGLGLNSVKSGGYTFFVGEAVEEVYSTFDSLITDAELTDQEKARFIFAKTY